MFRKICAIGRTEIWLKATNFHRKQLKRIEHKCIKSLRDDNFCIMQKVLLYLMSKINTHHRRPVVDVLSKRPPNGFVIGCFGYYVIVSIEYDVIVGGDIQFRYDFQRFTWGFPAGFSWIVSPCWLIPLTEFRGVVQSPSTDQIILWNVRCRHWG